MKGKLFRKTAAAVLAAAIVGGAVSARRRYINVLKADGFVQRYDGSDSVLYKDLGGEYLVFSSVEAFNDLDVMSVGMHRTKNPNDM